MQGPNSIIMPLNVPVLAPGATWPSTTAQPSTQSPMYKMNNNQINDSVRVLIFAPYGLTLNILQSNDGINWSILYSGANTAGELLDSGWVNPTMRYFQVQIINGATQQGGDIYANAQQTNPAPIDARLCLYMQEPETLSGVVDVAISGSIAVDSGTATGGSGTTLIDTSKDWGTNLWSGAILTLFRAGAQYAAVSITSNTYQGLVFPAPTGAPAITAGDTYKIAASGSSSTIQMPVDIQSGGTTLVGVATGGSTSGLVDTSQSWTVGALIGAVAYITHSGTRFGPLSITGNSSTAIAFAVGSNPTYVSGDTYTIIPIQAVSPVGTYVDQYFSGSTTATLTMTTPGQGFEISNDGTSSLTFTLTFADTTTLGPVTLMAGEISNEQYSKQIASVAVTTTGAYRAWGKV